MTERLTSSSRPLRAAKQSAIAQAPPGIGGWAREYAADLHRFLSKRRFVESDIKDVCQEVYLRLLRFERTEVIQNPLAYLFRVAANVAHDFRLRQMQWTPLEAEQLEAPTPEPGPGQVLVKVGAVSVNPIDTYIRSGAVAMPLTFPFVLGCDLAGTVVKLGPNVSRLKIGGGARNPITCRSLVSRGSVIRKGRSRISLATNPKRLRGNHAQTKR